MPNPSDLPHLSTLNIRLLYSRVFYLSFKLTYLSLFKQQKLYTFTYHEDVLDAFPQSERTIHCLDDTLYHKLFLNNELLA
jgi:hypothetical protein